MSTTNVSALADSIRGEIATLDATRIRLQAALDALTKTSAKPVAPKPNGAAKAQKNGSRRAPGATRAVVIEALRNHSGEQGLTATEIANATGLGRGSISTTLSKLARKGVATRTARGYAMQQ